MTTEQTAVWTDEQYAAYALGMRTERELQEALARLAMEKHQAIIAAQAARIEELEGTLDQVATESDMIFDRGAQRLARIKELEAELATAKSEAAYWNYHYNEAVLEAQLAAAQHEPVTIDDRPHLISKAQFRGIEELGYAICRRVPAAQPKQEALGNSPQDMPMPDWSKAPEWANWWAVNADLEAFWYSFKPYPLTNLEDACWQWSDADEFGRHRSAGEAVLPIGIDWRTALVARPAAQPKQGGRR